MRAVVDGVVKALVDVLPCRDQLRAAERTQRRSHVAVRIGNLYLIFPGRAVELRVEEPWVAPFPLPGCIYRSCEHAQGRAGAGVAADRRRGHRRSGRPFAAAIPTRVEN